MAYVPYSGKKRELRSPLLVLYQKELADHLRSKRFYLVFALLLLTTITSLFGAVSNLSREVAGGSEFIFLRIFTTSGDNIFSFATFIAFLGPLAGITLGFDAINNERALGTLSRLSSQPIYRDAIINAKFLAGTAVIFIIVAALVLFVCGAGLVLIGIPPGTEEVFRIIAFAILSAIYICVWLAASVIFSVISKHAATAAIAGISIWLFLSLFIGLVARAIANAIYPLRGIEGLANLERNFALNVALNRISPYFLFNEAATTILNPRTRSIGLVTLDQLSGAIDSSLSFGQSLLLVWPHIAAMTALVMLGFAFAYVNFMRQEIRA